MNEEEFQLVQMIRQDGFLGEFKQRMLERIKTMTLAEVRHSMEQRRYFEEGIFDIYKRYGDMAFSKRRRGRAITCLQSLSWPLRYREQDLLREAYENRNSVPDNETEAEVQS